MNVKGDTKMLSMMRAIPEYETGVKEKESPLDSLVKKFER